MKFFDVQSLKAMLCKLQKDVQEKDILLPCCIYLFHKKLNLHIRRQAAKDSFRNGIDWPAQSKTEPSSDADGIGLYELIRNWICSFET